MDAELSKDYEVIVVGTGMVECLVAAAVARVGKKILHIDRYDYYGGEWSSFTLQGAQQWVDEVTTLQEEPQQATVTVEEGEQLVAVSDPRRVYSLVKQAWHVPKESVVSSETDQSASAVECPPDPSSTTGPPAAPTPEAATTSVTEGRTTSPETEEVSQCEGSSGSTDTTPPTAETVVEAAKIEDNTVVQQKAEEEHWSQDKLMKLSRRFNLDLAPKVLYCRGPMVELLISSNVARYTEFKTVRRLLTWVAGEGLVVVPCSREDVFTTAITRVEKTLLGRLVKTCLSKDDTARQLEETWADRPFLDFLKAQRLTERLIHYVLESMAMVEGEAPCREGLARTRLFLTSVGRYGDGHTPFLFSMYGCGELPQAFCRLCAVFEGTYVLRKPVSSLILNPENLCCGLFSEGERFSCSHLVMGASHCPQQYQQQQQQQHTLSRGIFITDRSLLASDQEQLTLLRLPAQEGNPKPVVVLEVGASAGVCPQKLYCVHMTCRGQDAEKDLKVAVERLLTGPNSPTILWSLYFNQVEWDEKCGEDTPPNLHLCSGPNADLDYDAAISQAHSIFSTMFPDEEFLPRAPDPEEIVFPGAEGSDDVGSNVEAAAHDEAGEGGDCSQDKVEGTSDCTEVEGCNVGDVEKEDDGSKEKEAINEEETAAESTS